LGRQVLVHAAAMKEWIVLAAVAAACAFVLTALVTRYARRHLLDIPNDRSSHATPTPRGGGLAIAIVVSIGLLVLGIAGAFDGRAASFLLLAGGAMAWIGWVDDRRGVRPAARFGVHVAAVLLLIAGTAGLGPLTLPLLPPSSAIHYMAASFALAWLINLFNFMDGIDGLAGAEAVFFTVGLSVCMGLIGSGDGSAVALAALVCGAALGFLAWNWPPARVFMGDVGSGFLGFVLGAVALVAHRESELSLWVPTILLGVFVTDATITLARRIARGDRWYAAHRSHAYQRLARKHGAHRPVTIGAVAINLFWLLPLAVMAALHPERGSAIAALAYAPLVAYAVLAGAGRAD